LTSPPSGQYSSETMFRFAGFSSVWALITAPFRAIWRLIVRFFPERDVTIISNKGDLTSYHQSSFWYFARTMGKVVLVAWAFWATYTFIYHRPMLQSRTRQLEEARAQHARQMSDLGTYYQKFSDLNRDMNVIDDQILNSKKLTPAEADALLKKRLNTWAQLDFLQAKLSEIFTNARYEPEITKMSDLSLNYDLTNEENKQLRAQNAQMESAMQKIYDADSQIISYVTQLADDKTGALDKELKKISGTLASLGLNNAALAERAARISNPTVGSAIPPIILAQDMDPKYQQLANKIGLWQGLMRADSMLPVGAPVNNPKITSAFGVREDPIDGGTRRHTGIDFVGTVGTPLFSVAPGRVIEVGERSGYGHTVEIDHGMGFTTLYAHLSKANVAKGDWVEAKDVVGFGGSSGRSTGPHLHYEIRYNNTPFNPYSFVK